MIQLTARQLRYLLIVSLLLLLTGFVAPMLTISKFIVVQHSLSLLTGIWQLATEGQFFLFIIISLFSIIMPIAKIVLLFNLLHPAAQHSERRNKLLHLMHDYGRWAMLDVMVVAILIVSVKLGAIASIQVHAGLYIFGSAVLLIMFITHQVVRLHSHTLSTMNVEN